MDRASWLSSFLSWARTSCSAVLWDRATRCRAAIILAAILVCAYALAVLAYVITIPEIGIRCAFTPVVNHFYQEFLYPQEGQRPLQEGDVVVAVAGEEVQSWSHLLRQMLVLRDREPEAFSGSATDLLRSPKHFVEIDGERVVRVDYRHGSDDRVAWCRLGPAPVETLVPSVLWFFLKVGLFIVGAIVLWKRPDDASAATFFLLCICSFGAYLGGYHWSRIVTQPVLLIVFMTCAVLLPAVTLHFYLVFPRPKPFYQRHAGTVLQVVYGVPVFFLVLLLSGYVRARWLDSPLVLQEMLFVIYTCFGMASLMYLGSVACLVHSYWTAATPIEQNQVRWIMLGAAAATLPIGYSLYLAVFESGRFGGGAATWPMFAASACVTVAYTVSITRYRLMQLDQLLSSGAVYFMVSTLAGGLYYAVVFAGLLAVGSRFVEGPSLVQVLAVSSTALLVMVTLDLARGRLMRVLDRHYRREKNQLDHTLQRMSQAIELLVDPPALAHRLLHTSAELLSAPGGAVYLRQGVPGVLRLSDAIGPTPPLTELSPGCPLVEAVRQGGTYRPGGPNVPAQRQLAFLNGGLAQALLHEGQLLGLLVLSPRRGGSYSDEDVHLLAAFAQVTALALVSAEGHHTIETLNRELKAKVEKIAEQQRRILALQSQLTKRQAAAATTEEPTSPTRDGPVMTSARMQQLVALARRVAGTNSAVLLRGESGTGKEVFARILHEASPRAGRPFVKVHCAALSAGLLESELFGHVKGAFTNAIRDKVGRFEAADSGTLFLDEIGDISLDVQTKLLRVLEEMSFERVGSSEPVKVDVRIIAATHRDLEAMIRDGRFREDLFFRLNVISIALPPLRERPEDVPELVQHFLELYGVRTGKKGLTLDDDALMVLKGHDWPGNVRELENVIERAVVIAEGPTIGVDDLPLEVRRPGPEGPENGVTLAELAATIQAGREDGDRREREQLVRALAAANGNKSEAARALGWARSTLVSRLKKYGLS